jgi:glycosyltransferase involved in cell wall biosynthesis
MSEEGLVSIIIPAYNAADYLKEAVDSALAQTYENCEIIVVDDGSTDETKKVLEPYVEKNKIKYVYQQNKGLSGARNTGIRESTGNYVALLDADDLFLPTKIERQVDYLEKNVACDVSYCDLYHFWDGEPDKLLKLNYLYYSGKDVFPNLLARSFIAPVTVLFRRNVFERFGYFDESIRQYAEDFEFWLRLSYRGANICFLPEILAKLRLRKEGNIQSNQPMMKLTALRVIENLYREMPPSERARYNMENYLRAYKLKTAFAYLMIGDKKSALKFLECRSLLRSAVALFPAPALKFAVSVARYCKQRLLLKRA